MRRSLFVLMLAVALLCAGKTSAQYYTWGSDAPMKWHTIRTPDLRMIYPDTASSLARRTLFFARTVRPDIGYGFRHGPMRIPFVMHPENFQSNGLVMYLPKRVEFLTSPAIGGYSMPWYKQLVAHEYRHAVQYNNLDRGVVRVLSYILGQQGSTLGLLFMPIWALEGDATMSETMMSTYGRGLQPSFTLGYRAEGHVGADRRNVDRWFCGSFRDYVPDHYQLGYQICSYAYEHYDENIWNKVVRYSVRNPYVILATRVSLGRYYQTNTAKLFRATFSQLDSLWQSLPKAEDSAASITTLPEKNYTTYEFPLSLDDTTALVLKTDYARPTRFVRVDTRTGEERTVAHVGSVSTRPALGNGRVWWTEYRRSKLFEQRVNSQLCYMDLADGKPRTFGGIRRALYPTPAGNDMAWVDYNPDGRYTIVVNRVDGRQDRFSTPDRSEIHGLAWDDLTLAFYVLVTDDSGMWLGRIDPMGVHPLTRGAYVTLSNLRAGGGKLYFGSISSGKDEAHCFDLIERVRHREYRLTTSAYGSFSPAPAGDEVLVTTYDRRGYRLARQAVTDNIPVEWAKTPVNRVNPVRKRWDVVNLDTVRFSDADSVAQERKFRSKRYRKVPNLVNVHSWMPLSFDPFKAVDEHNVNLNLGVTLLSQNLLSNTEAFASYGWNSKEGSLFKAGVRYFGLGVHFDFDVDYGGNQLFYSLEGRDPATGKPAYQKRPAADKYFSVGFGATLPLYFQQGYHTRQFSVSADWNYSNGMVADLGKVKWEGSNITNIEHIGFEQGLHKLSFGAGFSDQVRLAHRDFAPRWAYLVSGNYTFNPANRNFSDLVSFYGQVHLPGVAAHHSLRLGAAYQTSIGGYELPGGHAPLSYRSTRLIPRGFTSADIVSDNYTAFSADYQLPVWYPEGGIGSLLYFKRIRLGVGGDYAQFRVPSAKGNAFSMGGGLDYSQPLNPGVKSTEWRRLWSVGGDIILDINLFRQPASATSTVKLSVYRPSSGGVWVTAGVGLPF